MHKTRSKHTCFHRLKQWEAATCPVLHKITTEIRSLIQRDTTQAQTEQKSRVLKTTFEHINFLEGDARERGTIFSAMYSLKEATGGKHELIPLLCQTTVPRAHVSPATDKQKRWCRCRFKGLLPVRVAGNGCYLSQHTE